MTTDHTPSLAELEIRSELFDAMDGNLRMSRRHKLLDAYRDAVLAAAPTVLPPVSRAAVYREVADFVRDAYLRDGLSVQKIDTALRHMADETSVVPPPALTEEGRLRMQVEVLQQDAERDRGLAKVGARCMREGHQGLIEGGRLVLEGWRFALSTALGLGTGAPWEAIHERAKELRRMADEEQPAAVHRPRRGDQFEAWLKAQRDQYGYKGPTWTDLDNVLDSYRLHADTGTPLDQHVCDGPHCDCPPADEAAAAPAGTEEAR